MSKLKGQSGLVTGWWVMLAAAGMLVGCSVGTAEAKVIEDSFVIGTPARLMVISDNGRVEVTSTSPGDNTIKVTATVRNPERVEYSAVQEGSTVRVVAKVDDGPNFLDGGSGVDILISVPPEIDLELESSNGTIRVSGITGSVSSKTSNGRVSITGVVGDVKVETSNGAVELADLSGQVMAETSNGSIDYSGTLRPGSENSLKTSNGSIEVALTDTPGVELTAATSNGRVSSALPITTSGEAKDNELKGTIGDGGSRLEISASNGSITIK